MSIEKDITDHIDASIAGMTISGGYNYDYADVNERNPDDMSFPNVFSTYISEDADSVEGNVANKYTAFLTAFFVVTVDDSTAVDIGLDNVLEDFKRMFDDQKTTLNEKGMIKERYQSKEKFYSLVTKRPGYIEITWELTYRVSMDNPSST